jgi:hypothetical protein
LSFLLIPEQTDRSAITAAELAYMVMSVVSHTYLLSGDSVDP